jgi:putative NADPH-quinone reductase
VAELDFPLLHTKEEWDTGTPPPAVRTCQEAIAWADHLMIVYPLWLGSMPALLKAFFEQALRPGFAVGRTAPGTMWPKLLKGKSTRIVVTMGMPAFFYRWYFRAHSLKSLERNILAFCGIGPIRTTLIGRVESAPPAKRAAWLAKLRKLGGMAY